MKVAITGHTSGVGKALYHKFDDVVGLSRSNGYNINDPVPILDRVKDCDVFVNNAHSGYSQVDLLYMLWSEWKDTPKTIVCISSNAAKMPQRRVNMYANEKLSLTEACRQLNYIHEAECKIMCINPGYVDTPRVSQIDAPKMSTSELADLIHTLVTMNKTYRVSDITLETDIP